MKKSQVSVILDRLLSGKSVTSYEAFKKYGITRLSSVIFMLRNRGYNIKTEIIKSKSRYGNESQYAKYWMEAK